MKRLRNWLTSTFGKTHLDLLYDLEKKHQKDLEWEIEWLTAWEEEVRLCMQGWITRCSGSKLIGLGSTDKGSWYRQMTGLRMEEAAARVEAQMARVEKAHLELRETRKSIERELKELANESNQN